MIAGHQPSFHIGIFVYDPDVDALRLAAQVLGAGEDDEDGVVPGSWLLDVDESVSGRVYRTGAPILIPDVHLDPDYRARPGSRTRSELIVPIVAGDRVVAVASLEAPWVSAFTIEDYDRVRGQVEVLGPSFPRDDWG